MRATPEMELFRLDGRTAFVSGAAGHLGRAMALSLSEAGAHLVLNGRDRAPLEALAQAIRKRDRTAELAVFDVADLPVARAFFQSCSRVDVLVNNAITMSVKPFSAVTDGDFTETYRSGVVAPFEMARAALPALRNAAHERGEACIVNVSSMYGIVSPDSRLYAQPEQASPFHYGPAKAALLQLTRHLAAEFGKDRIRVNALVPGPFPREGVRSTDLGFAKRLAERTMLGRVGEADEIRGPLLFLASPASSFVTGAALMVDGGWTVW